MGLQTQHRACIHRALKECWGSERRSRESTYSRDIQTQLVPEGNKVSMDPAHRAIEYVHTPIWRRIQCSPGPKSQAKQTLTVFRNQCLQAHSISILCIHMAWGNHITGLQKLVLRERPESLLRSTKHMHT